MLEDSPTNISIPLNLLDGTKRDLLNCINYLLLHIAIPFYWTMEGEFGLQQVRQGIIYFLIYPHTIRG